MEARAFDSLEPSTSVFTFDKDPDLAIETDETE
jgi:hypothetical protein